MADLPTSLNTFEFFETVWRRRLLVTLVAAVVIGLMVTYLNFATYKYSATVKVIAAQSGSSSLSSQLGSLGGLASIANVRLPQGAGEQNFLVFTQNLVSRTAAERLMRHPELVHIVFRDEWDEQRHVWVEPHGFIRRTLPAIKGLLGLPNYPYKAPDAARMQDYLEHSIGVAEDARKPIVALSYAHKDPKFAVHLLQTIVEEVDEDVRRRALARAQGNIAYLDTQLRTVQLAESRLALAAALGEQEKTRMLASSQAPFAGEPIGPIGVSDRPSPRPFILLLAAIVGGTLLGALTVLVLPRLRRGTITRNNDTRAAEI